MRERAVGVYYPSDPFLSPAGIFIARLIVILLPFLSMIPWREIFRGD